MFRNGSSSAVMLYRSCPHAEGRDPVCPILPSSASVRNGSYLEEKARQLHRASRGNDPLRTFLFLRLTKDIADDVPEPLSGSAPPLEMRIIHKTDETASSLPTTCRIMIVTPASSC